MRRVLVLLCVVGVIRGHLLPQALEDVHDFVQSELQQRSHDKLGIEGPPSGGPVFHTSQTQAYIGIPVMLQKEVKFDGNGAMVSPISADLNTAPSQNVERGSDGSGNGVLPRGLIPPSPLEQQAAQSSGQPQIIPANLVGPSTFVSDAPRDGSEGTEVPPQLLPQESNRGQGKEKTMEGWVPLDSLGSRLAKGLGVKLQVGEEQQETVEQDPGFTIKSVESGAGNEVEILRTNSVKLGNIVIDAKDEKEGKRYPVYTGGQRSPKVVIHAQNVIIRDGPDSDVRSGNASNVKQYSAYGGVPQLNNYLRDQLRLAAMNQLLQSQRHPLNNKPFPRPLSLREIAAAVRSGQFPEPPQDPLLSQSSQMQISIPHMVKMNPEVAASIQSQSKVPFPGGLGNLYRNLLRDEGGPPRGFDPREPLEYPLLAALSGQKLKTPSFRPKPPSHHDYGDSVAYTTGKDLGSKEPIEIVDAQSGPAQNPGSLRDVSEQLLKHMILQELQEIQETPSVVLPSGYQNPARLPLRNLKHSGRPPLYGTNAHPFAYLGEGSGPGGAPDAVFEETYEYSLPPGVSVDDYMNDDGKLSAALRKKPSHRYPPPGYPSEEGDGKDSAVPLNTDTLLQFGKGLLHQALDFSRHHNPMTLISKIRSLPPVKVDLYKVPMGIPDSVMDKLPQKWRADDGGSRRGSGPSSRGGKRGRRKNLPRKNSSRY